MGIFGSLFGSKKPVQEWADEKLLDLYLNLAQAASQQSNIAKRSSLHDQAHEVYEEIIRRQEYSNSYIENCVKKDPYFLNKLEQIGLKVKSKFEKALLETATNTLGLFGYDQSFAIDLVKDAKINTQKMVDRFSLDGGLETTTFGNIIIKNEKYLSERVEYGLTAEDIRNFWNKGLWFRNYEAQFRDIFFFTAMKAGEEKGLSEKEAYRAYFKEAPRYGATPGKYNEDWISQEDSDLPIELKEQVDKWSNSENEDTQQGLFDSHSSFNSVIRTLISTNKLKQ